jgi:hypothetical protein
MSHPSSLLLPPGAGTALVARPVHALYVVPLLWCLERSTASTRAPALLPPSVHPQCNRDALIFADYMLWIQVEVTLRGRGGREGRESLRVRARARRRGAGGRGGLRSLVDPMALRSARPPAGR